MAICRVRRLYYAPANAARSVDSVLLGGHRTAHGAHRGPPIGREPLQVRTLLGEGRMVPCPLELTAHLHAHIRQFGTAPDGRLFTGERNAGELPKLTITRASKRARTATFIPDVAAGPLAGTPYDLRHAAVSTWLSGGVPATTVAAWAGHSVEVLLKIYAKCLDGETTAVHRRIEAALGHSPG